MKKIINIIILFVMFSIFSALIYAPFDSNNPDTWTEENLKDSNNFEAALNKDPNLISNKPELLYNNEIREQYFSDSARRSEHFKNNPKDMNKYTDEALEEIQSKIPSFKKLEGDIKSYSYSPLSLETAKGFFSALGGLGKSLLGIDKDGNFLFKKGDKPEMKLTGKITSNEDGRIMIEDNDGKKASINGIELQGNLDAKSFEDGIIKGEFSSFMGFEGTLILQYMDEKLTFDESSIVSSFPSKRPDNLKSLYGSFQVKKNDYPTGSFNVIDTDTLTIRFYDSNNRFDYKYVSNGKALLKFDPGKKDNIALYKLNNDNSITFFKEGGILLDGVVSGRLSQYDFKTIEANKNGQKIPIIIHQSWERSLIDKGISEDEIARIKPEVEAQIIMMKKYFTEMDWYEGNMDGQIEASTNNPNDFENALINFQKDFIKNNPSASCIGKGSGRNCGPDGYAGSGTMAALETVAIFKSETKLSFSDNQEVPKLKSTRNFIVGRNNLPKEEIEIIEKFLKENDLLERKPTGSYDSEIGESIKKLQEKAWGEDKNCLGTMKGDSCSFDTIVGQKVRDYINTKLADNKNNNPTSNIGSAMLINFNKEDGKNTVQVQVSGETILSRGTTVLIKSSLKDGKQHFYTNPERIGKDKSITASAYKLGETGIISISEILAEDLTHEKVAEMEIGIPVVSRGSGSISSSSRSEDNQFVFGIDRILFDAKVLAGRCPVEARENLKIISQKFGLDLDLSWGNRGDAHRVEDNAIKSKKEVWTIKRTRSTNGDAEKAIKAIEQMMKDNNKERGIFQLFSKGYSTDKNGQTYGHTYIAIVYYNKDTGELQIDTVNPTNPLKDKSAKKIPSKPEWGSFVHTPRTVKMVG